MRKIAVSIRKWSPKRILLNLKINDRAITRLETNFAHYDSRFGPVSKAVGSLLEEMARKKPLDKRKIKNAVFLAEEYLAGLKAALRQVRRIKRTHARMPSLLVKLFRTSSHLESMENMLNGYIAKGEDQLQLVNKIKKKAGIK